MSTKANEPTLSDIPIVRDFKDVFLDNLSGLPPQRQVEFRIDLIPRATPVSEVAISTSAFRDARTVGATSRVARQGIYSAKSLTMGSASFVCQEE
ncbi:hypothetical protein Tco_0101682 [Tanacetum coccineum]